MKDSGVQWIGQVPKHWEVCKIKNIGLFYSGLVNKRGDDFNVEETDKFAYYIPFTNIFNNVEIDVTQLRKVKVNPVEAQNEAKENDIFFLMSSEDTEGIGKTAVLRELTAEYKPLYLNSFCKGLRITSNEVDAIFLNYFMSSDAGNTYCRLQANGFIRINLRLTKLVDCPVLLPPLSEQRAIADWLDAKCADIDAAIELQQRMIDKLKAYKTAVIHQAVTKGLDKNLKPTDLKDSGIKWLGMIPKHWVKGVLSSYFYQQKELNLDLREQNLLSLSYGKIIDKDITTKEGLLPKSFDNYNVIQKGDIVFRLTDLQNDKKSLRTGLCKRNGIITSAYVTIRKKIELCPDFFAYLFYVYDICKVYYGLGSGVRQGLNFNELKKLPLVLPPTLAEQRAIADWLDAKCADIDATIALKEQKQEKLKAYKKTIIFEYVTGKKQVANINKQL